MNINYYDDATYYYEYMTILLRAKYCFERVCLSVRWPISSARSATSEDRATRYVSKFVLCFTSYESYKGFKQQK